MLIALVAITVGLSLVAGALALAAERSVERVEVDGLQGSRAPDREVADNNGQPPAGDASRDGDLGEEQGRSPGTQSLEEPITLLLVGLDSREGLTREQLHALGTEDHGAELTDGLMLVRLDPEKQQVTALSLPRDLLVERCDGTRGKINGAYHIGELEGRGPSCVVQTVTGFTGIPADHYLQVDLAGFIEVVDVLGGIHLHLDEPLKDTAAGLDLPAGCVQLDGPRALAFVRARKSLDGAGDLGRIERQQLLLSQVVRDMTDAGTLTDVPELFALVATAGGAMETDEQLSLNLVRRLALVFRDADSEDVAMFTVPGQDEIRGNASYVIPAEGAAEIFEHFADGTLDEEVFAQHADEPGTRASTATAPRAVAPAEPAPAAGDHAAAQAADTPAVPVESAPAHTTC